MGRTYQLKRTKAPFKILAPRIAAQLDASKSASLIQKNAIPNIGIGLLAAIDGICGILQCLPRFPQALPFAGWVPQALNIPAFLDRPTNVLTRAEHWLKTASSTISRSSHRAWESALAKYTDGQLHMGDRRISSQFTHVKILPDGGAPCVCGGNGCLIAYASMSGIAARISERRGIPPPPSEILADAFQGLVRVVRSGHHAAAQLFAVASTALFGVANNIGILDPRQLLVSCEYRDPFDLIKPSF